MPLNVGSVTLPVASVGYTMKKERKLLELVRKLGKKFDRPHVELLFSRPPSSAPRPRPRPKPRRR